MTGSPASEQTAKDTIIEASIGREFHSADESVLARNRAIKRARNNW
jgi:hypothetical protein